MTPTVQPREGSAFTEYQLVFSKTGTPSVVLFESPVVVFSEAEIQDSVYGVGKGRHTFRTGSPQFLDTVRQAMSTANPIMRFRVGFGNPSNTYWLPWQQHVIASYSAKFEGIDAASGHLLTFSTANELIRMERSNKVIARSGLISDIVAAIAAENGLEAVVEPTNGKFTIFQSFIDDTRFIQNRLAMRAINVKGQGGYYFYIRDNVMHFHTPDYQASVWKMDYYDSYGKELSITDNSQIPDLWDAGVAGIRIIEHSSYTGTTREVSSQPQNGLKLADSAYQFASVQNGQWNMPYHLSENPSIETSAIAQYRYQCARQKVFRCDVCVDKTLDVRHGDLLNLSIPQESSKASVHSGYYYVTAVAHRVTRQSVTSILTLERGEVGNQLNGLTTQSANAQIVPVTEAPGNFPNILELQNSDLTRGAGKRTSATTYTVVTDAATGKRIA